MKRNKETQFALLPTMEHKRSRFDLSHSHKFTMNIGDVVPFYVQEILPGSTVEIATSKLIRLQTPVAPIMDNISFDTYYFFVPNRLVWTDFAKFQGENDTASWAVRQQLEVPHLSFPANTGTDKTNSKAFFAIGSVADYMGLPAKERVESFTPADGGSQITSHHAPCGGAPFGSQGENEIDFNILPFRAYALICNEWFRDENLTDPLLFSKTSAGEQGVYDSTSLSVEERTHYSGLGNLNDLSSAARGGRCFTACKYHDYFTSCLPNALKSSDGAEVRIPIVNINDGSPTSGAVPTLKATSGGITSNYYIIRDSTGALKTSNTLSNALGSNLLYDGYAGITINSLRLAFATQSQLELDARAGSRYTEIVRSNFGCVSPDARLQRPEYLGGNHFMLNVNQVLSQTGNYDGAKDSGHTLGDTGAFSCTADGHGDFIQSFTEHGYIIGVCVARYDHSYQNGANKMWFRRNRFDFYMPAFAQLGEMPVRTAEIYIDDTIHYSDVFGYQEAWSEYRYMPNRVSAEMRSTTPNSLDVWHLADDYTSRPYLSDSWIREDRSNVDRVLSVTSKAAHQILCDFYIDNKSTLPLPMYSIPATLGHF